MNTYNINHKLELLISIYFDTFPYSIYNIGNNNSNFAFLGIGLGLINVRRMFWVSMISIIYSIFYLKNNIYKLNYIIICIAVIFIIISLYKANYLLNKLLIKE